MREKDETEKSIGGRTMAIDILATDLSSQVTVQCYTSEDFGRCSGSERS